MFTQRSARFLKQFHNCINNSRAFAYKAEPVFERSRGNTSNRSRNVSDRENYRIPGGRKEDTFGTQNRYVSQADRIKDDPDDIEGDRRINQAEWKPSYSGNRSYRSRNVSDREDYEIPGRRMEDTFGTLNEYASQCDRIKDDPDDIEEARRIDQAEWKPIMHYIKAVKQYLDQNEYQKALDVLEVDMLKVDKKKPVPFIYNLLISYNGDRGNIKEAYRLFVKMKQRGLFLSGGLYTSLLNACANSDHSQIAVEKAELIFSHLSQNEKIEVNISHYNCLMKVYARHGDLSQCLKIMDEVIKRKGKVKDKSYNFLMQACVTDKNAGFRNALLIYHKMLKNRTNPTVFTFNLMLRCTRECSLGPVELIEDAINDILGSSEMQLVKEDQKLLDDTRRNFSKPVEVVEETRESKNELGISKAASEVVLPNLLDRKPVMGSVIQFRNVLTPQHRFMLLGGLDGFLQTMANFNVEPNVKTFSMLLDVIPDDEESEEKLIKKAEEYKIKIDTGFVNILLKRRIFRNADKSLIKSTIELLQNENQQPDLISFGIRAMNCDSLDEAITFIQELRECGFRLNVVMATSLMRNAAILNDLKFAKMVLDEAKRDEVHLSSRFIAKLRNLLKRNEHLDAKQDVVT